MGKRDKKKGKGAEKTAAKTEKKVLQKMKKELAAKGEDEIEKLIAEFREQDKKRSAIVEEQCPPPSPRSAVSLCAHPDKEELVLFGGEYFNGNKTFMYNDLYFYNIKKDQWRILQCPVKPPPRCSHQAVMVSQCGGQMWVFGGEFASPTRSNFYHYKDLWVYHIAQQQWEQVKSPGAPSARSGHRMIASRKQLVVFGGFHESVRDYKYFNDVYVFDLEKYQWTKIDPVGKCPSPRSGCQLAPLIDGKVLLYGGYSREKVKKDVDRGTVHTDMFNLQLEEKNGVFKWKWVMVKQCGCQPIPRSGFSMATGPGNKAFVFGGVHDEDEDEESLTGIFHNDFYSIELDKGRWLPVILRGKPDKTEKKKRRKAKDEMDVGDENQSTDEEDISNKCKDISISEENKMEQVQTFSEDGIFTVKIGPQCSSTESNNDTLVCSSSDSERKSEVFTPHPRMNAGMVVKNGILYLYGGLYEDGDKQFTLSDMYAIDVHKMEDWKVIIPLNTELLEWVESEDSSSHGSSSEGSDDENDGMEVE